MDSKSVMNAAAGVLKKGPWTTAEDAILMEYVRKHGEGNWNSVQKNSGLMRCGKSCRLRWANHLRPNLKKGSFSAAEERIIIDLHSKFGNKWARMASQLPGRTDNEIKNFWNTRMKRRQRAGLPIYPQQLHENSTTIHHQQEHYEQKHPNPSPFSCFGKPAYNLPPPFLDSITFTPTFNPLQNNFHNSPFYSNPTLQFKSFPGPNNTNDLSLPLSPVPHPSSLSSFHSFTDQSVPTKTPLMCYNFNNNNVSFTSLIMDDQGQNGLVPELPSNQTPPPPPCPNTDFSVGVFFGNNEMKEPEIQGENRSSGLLDTLVMESQNLALKEKMNGEDLVGMLDKGKRKMDEKEEEEDDEKESSKRAKLSSTNSGVASATNLSCEDITSSQSSIGTKPSEEPMEEMNSMDDDLLSLLDNFPSMTPLPEWYRTKNVSEGMSTGDIVQEVEPQQDDSSARADETRNVEWGLGSSSSSFWNNMPSIY